MHGKGRAPYDIKPGNMRVNVDSEGNIRSVTLIDWGSSVVFDGEFQKRANLMWQVMAGNAMPLHKLSSLQA